MKYPVFLVDLHDNLKIPEIRSPFASQARAIAQRMPPAYTGTHKSPPAYAGGLFHRKNLMDDYFLAIAFSAAATISSARRLYSFIRKSCGPT